MLATRWKELWRITHGIAWDADCGYPLMHGGTLPPYTATLPGTFTITEGSAILSADSDVSATMQEGDRCNIDGTLYTVESSTWNLAAGVTTVVLSENYQPPASGAADSSGSSATLPGMFTATPGGTYVRVLKHDITADLTIGDMVDLDGVVYTIGKVQPRNNPNAVSKMYSCTRAVCNNNSTVLFCRAFCMPCFNVDTFAIYIIPSCTCAALHCSPN